MKSKRLLQAGIIVAAMAVVCLSAGAGVAQASYLYTFSSDVSGYAGTAQFSETSILTATTTISSFSSNTFSNLGSLTIAPESGEDCDTFSTGPCIAANFGAVGGTNVYFFSSNLTSPGTYNTVTLSNRGALQISAPAAAPEPGALTLSLFALGALVLYEYRKRRLAAL